MNDDKLKSDNEDVINSDIKTISLEDKIAEAEQEITNSNYEKDTFINYHGARLEFRMKKISQAAFEKTSRLLKNSNDASVNRKILEEYLINKNTGVPFTPEQIHKIFTAGMVTRIANKIMEESDFDMNEMNQMALRNFPG
jgi:hypothetical protein